MPDAPDTLLKKGIGARVTLRLSEWELGALRDLAEAREEDLTSVTREAIGGDLDREKDEAARRTEHQPARRRDHGGLEARGRPGNRAPRANAPRLIAL